jgi:hypothetical protein
VALGKQASFRSTKALNSGSCAFKASIRSGARGPCRSRLLVLLMLPLLPLVQLLKINA